MQKKRVMTCLIAGVCILAVSVTAAFGSVNGYANYKTAVKSLALETDNVSIDGSFRFSYDGSPMMNGAAELAKDGRDMSSHILIQEGDGRAASEEWSTTLDGVTTWFSLDDEHYYQGESDSDEDAHGLLDVSSDDEFSRRMITFLEMGADTVMGDLKNNVVEIGSENGDVTYQLDISKDQVPALVNAGLNLAAYAMSESLATSTYVEWEDYNQMAFAYYEEQTGETLSQDFRDQYDGESYDEDWWENNRIAIERFDEVTGELYGKYYDILEEKREAAGLQGGILYVGVDGSVAFYPDVYAYKDACGSGDSSVDLDSIEDFIGEDLTLKNVHYTFSINKAGQLTANHCTLSFETTDRQGQLHELSFQADAVLKDYGTTTVRPLDVGGRTPFRYDG